MHQPLQWGLWPWPFFDASHEALAERVIEWNTQNHGKVYADMHEECRAMVRSFGASGLLDYVVPQGNTPCDLRSVCLIREGLTYEHALADAMFAMQGIGTVAIRRFGTPAQREEYLEPCRKGERIAAFALTEPETGSDVAAMTTTAVRDGDHYVINGAKTLISNAGMADHYLVTVRTGEAPGSRGLSMLLVNAGTPGLAVSAPIEFIAPHPAAGLTFTDCRVPVANLIGEAGQGFKAAMAAFDIFRPSVGAAGVGLARRAMHETLAHTNKRRLFSKPMHGLEGVQMALAEMATDLEGAALLVYRAAWAYDVRGERGAYEACMAKLAGSEAAGRIVDRAVQLLGGQGVTRGNIIELLYREARPMRIYEGASEIQKLIIARNLIKNSAFEG